MSCKLHFYLGVEDYKLQNFTHHRYAPPFHLLGFVLWLLWVFF